MKQRLIFTLLLFLSMGISAQNMRKAYEKNWEQVEEYNKQSLPQSAIKEVDNILKLAIADKNIPQTIKALIHKSENETQIDNSESGKLFQELEGLLSTTTDVSERALLHSILAEWYIKYYENDTWKINQRTKLIDDIPADMKEWSSNIFEDKTYAYLEASVKEKDFLKKQTTKLYDDIIIIGEDSKDYYPTLYDFLMKRAISTSQKLESVGREEFDISSLRVTIEQLAQPATEYTKLKIGVTKKYSVLNYYQQYLADLQQRGLTGTVILTELDKINYLRNLSNSFSNAEVLNALLVLEKRYGNNEVSVEIIDAMVDALMNAEADFYPRRATPKSENRSKEIYDWCKTGIKKYPNYGRIGVLKNRLASLENPQLTIEGSQLFYSDGAIEFDVFYKNTQAETDKINIELYKLEIDNGDNEDKKPIKEFPLNLISKATYESDTSKLQIGKLDYGRYKLTGTVGDGDKYDELNFSVSNLMSFSRIFGKQEYEIYVVDRKTGKPVKDAGIHIYDSDYDEADDDEDDRKEALKASLRTNELGLAIYKDKDEDDYFSYNTFKYKVIAGKDDGLKLQSLYSNNYYNRDESASADEDMYTMSVFSDRNIYRPGQTIHFKAIAVDKNSKAVKTRRLSVKLFNTNGEELSEKTLFTNDFGSISGEFVLPQGGLPGQYYISVGDNGHLSFNVEEYKRPTFEVKFDKIEQTYTFGEEVTLKGSAKTFSGISLQNTDVKYRITRRPFSFWFWNTSNQSHFVDGTVKTKDDGTFEIAFTPEAGDGKNNILRNQAYTFSITADVTDLNGETQSGAYTVSVGKESMILNVEVPDKIEKTQEVEINIGAKNLDGNDIETNGSYTIHTLDKNDSIQSQVLKGSFKTGKQAELVNSIKKLSSGKHRIVVKGLDNKGNEITAKTDFILYAYKDKKPPIETNNWVVEKSTTFKKDSPVEVIFGASDKDVYVLYQLYSNKEVFERKFIKISSENKLFSLPYKAGYGDEIYMSFTSVKDGELNTQNILLQKEQEKVETELKLKLEVFRDKLRPGEEETWTLSVKDTKQQAAVAEVLASMYDTSLDKIRAKVDWYLSRPYTYKEYLRPIYYNPSENALNRGSYNLSFNFSYPYIEVKHYNFDTFSWSYYSTEEFLMFDNAVLSETVVVGYGTSKKQVLTGALAGVQVEKNSSMKIRGLASVSADAEMDESAVMADKADTAGAGEQGTTNAEPQIRRNFNETAFFYPQLKTNEKGETQITFTVPESNTTWRFRAFAHDKNSKVGVMEKMVLTRKELMITPNMPRFVRQGDKTSIATKISNLSENSIKGDVKIEFFNPLDDKIVDLPLANQKQSFDLKKEASTSANWTFDIPADIDLLGVRIVAGSEYFSDGEQHVLSVLPNRMLVTESMPIDVTRKGEQKFVFDKLANNKSNSLKNYKLTFEFSSNPAWYAIQALPTMSNPSSENAVSWFASYYVNTLGMNLMKQYPKVATMIEAWKKQGGDKETLVSKLQKNDELKTIILEEAPWVFDAKNETEQMERLSLLFDINSTNQKTAIALNKLKELQTPTGAWSWYKGMYPSRSITQYLLYGLAELQLLGTEYPSHVKQMQINALKYIDQEIVKDFENLKKHTKNWEKIRSISTSQLEYLYMRAMYRDIPITQEAREAERFYTSVISKNWTKTSLYERALLTVLLVEGGDKDLAGKVSKSIKEHSVSSKELGMYWPNNRNHVFLSLSGVSTHVFMMEAMKVSGATQQELDNMKRWLIKQKQVQTWETTHASIDAINALLSMGSNWFASETKAPVIKLGTKTIETDNAELGTGYFKTSWHGTEIDKSMSTVSVNSEDSKPAYGALYWQYYEDLDKITKQDGSLNVNKELYKEISGKDGKSLAKVSESNPLNIGDKVIIRLVVRSDRDLEFVQLKDMRASCFEPLHTVSGMSWQNGAPYYQATKDASTNFYFDVLPKGTYVFEYPVYVNRTGEYSNGITSIQCAYAPEFVSHTAGIKVVVK